MAPLRGRGGGRGSGRLARSGIKTRAGYRKFDSQRVKEVEPVNSDDARSADQGDVLENGDDSTGEDLIETVPDVRAYSALLQSFHQPPEQDERQRKRRKVLLQEEVRDMSEDTDEEQVADIEADEDSDDQLMEAGIDGETPQSDQDHQDSDEDHEVGADPYEVHFANPDDNDLLRRLAAIRSNQLRTQNQAVPHVGRLSISVPQCVAGTILRKPALEPLSGMALKKRLLSHAQKFMASLDVPQRAITPYAINYTDLMFGDRTPQNAQSLRNLACLHALNHVLKGRDKLIKNNARLAHSEDQDLDVRDQGFTRPKVLVLLETRQMCDKYADTFVKLFQPDQQENKQRFLSSFFSPIEDRDNMPEDYRELFEGNNDNNFLTALKFTRKTLKFYAPFYTSDIILASPLGLRRILENEDPKKRDYDFLSSIEIVVVDQADAMQMQNWENVESVFRHLNLQLQEAHGCDFNRVRSWYLDGHARYLRQTMVFSAYITPEMNRLFNGSMLNVAGKAKFLPVYSAGAIASVGGSGIKQTMSRFDSSSPASDPEARFKYFTSTVLPALLRLASPADGAKGILIFLPSYYDFLRLRNFFATDTLTQNISFGAIHDYSDVSSQRRARSHLLSGRHSFLLYTQRAHHFYRLRIKGVKRVVMYGLPDNPAFYEELVAGFLGTSLEEGKIAPEEASARAMFSKWDGLKLERIVGTERVKGMLGGKGDTFDFV